MMEAVSRQTVALGAQHPSRNVYGWQLARYELPIREVERKLGSRYVTDIVVGTEEKLAYAHAATGRRVEFSRPRLDNNDAALEEAEAKWQCELAFAEEASRKRHDNGCGIVGFLDLGTVRTCKKIVADWNRRAATDPDWVRYPTKLQTVGAFGKGGRK